MVKLTSALDMDIFGGDLFQLSPVSKPAQIMEMVKLKSKTVLNPEEDVERETEVADDSYPSYEDAKALT